MKLPKQLAEIEKDCLKSKKKKDLTEYGEGELHIINILKNHYMIKGDKKKNASQLSNKKYRNF